MSRYLFIRFASVLMLALTPVVLSAQSVKSSGLNPKLDKAIALREKAIALYDDSARAADVARLHLEEVSYRSPSDPEAVEALFMAVFFFKYAGRNDDAKRTLEVVAERALAIGDVISSAQANIEAAFLAHKAKNKSETRRLAAKAWHLSASPLLRDEQRAWIRKQVESIPALAAAIH